MLDNPVIQNIFSVALYLLRIAVPLLSIVVVCRCFHSLKAGRRREDPVVILQDMVTKEIIPVLYWENSLGRSRSCDIVLHDSTVSRDHAVLMRRKAVGLWLTPIPRRGRASTARRWKTARRFCPAMSLRWVQHP